MLSDVYKDRLKVVCDEMVQIMAANKNTYKNDARWVELNKEKNHLENQINHYKKLVNGSNTPTTPIC